MWFFFTDFVIFIMNIVVVTCAINFKDFEEFTKTIKVGHSVRSNNPSNIKTSSWKITYCDDILMKQHKQAGSTIQVSIKRLLPLIDSFLINGFLDKVQTQPLLKLLGVISFNLIIITQRNIQFSKRLNWLLLNAFVFVIKRVGTWRTEFYIV